MSRRRSVRLGAQGTDEQLALSAQAGDIRAVETLMHSYEPFLRTLARPYFDPAGAMDDIYQEARIGFLKAVRDWSPSGGSSFKSFLVLAVRRQVITHLKFSNRAKHIQLTYAVRIAVLDDGERVDIIDSLEALHTDPASLIAARDTFRELVRLMRDELSPLERESLLGLVFLDETYEEIEARIFSFDGRRPGRAAFTPVKVVDNALSRARRKLRVALEEVASAPGDVGAASSSSRLTLTVTRYQAALAVVDAAIDAQRRAA